jgi:hypothetical protein
MRKKLNIVNNAMDQFVTANKISITVCHGKPDWIEFVAPTAELLFTAIELYSDDTKCDLKKLLTPTTKGEHYYLRLWACAKQSKSFFDIEQFSITFDSNSNSNSPFIVSCTFVFLNTPERIEYPFDYSLCTSSAKYVKPYKVPLPCSPDKRLRAQLRGFLINTQLVNIECVKSMTLHEFIRKYRFSSDKEDVLKAFRNLCVYGETINNVYVRELLAPC